jgi:hypothetical protein
MRRIIVVCEGRSEYVYLKRLQSFLDGQSAGWCFPLQLFPTEGGHTTGGDYNHIVSNYKAQRKENPRAKIEIWVDYDLYLRNDRDNRNLYLNKPRGIPDFRFSFHNFEDFLMMHMEDAIIEKWRSLLEPKNHFRTPLHAVDYVPLFQQIIPKYEKGDLPSDFVTAESLNRLKRNTLHPIITTPADSQFSGFASFLIGQIEEVYPDLFAAVPE